MSDSTVPVTIYHNPDCGTSRNTLGMIRNAGIEPHVIEYLKTPPARALLEQLIERMGVAVRSVLREKGARALWSCLRAAAVVLPRPRRRPDPGTAGAPSGNKRADPGAQRSLRRDRLEGCGGYMPNQRLNERSGANSENRRFGWEEAVRGEISRSSCTACTACAAVSDCTARESDCGSDTRIARWRSSRSATERTPTVTGGT